VISRFACRLIACVLWWVAAVVATAAYDEQVGPIAAVAWAAVILLVSAGAAMWKGGDDR